MQRKGRSDLNLQNRTTRDALIQFTEHGAQAGCPFCNGRRIASLSGGERIVFLKGKHSGKQATVSDDPSLFDDEFLVRFNFQPLNHTTRVSYLRDEFTRAPLQAPPKWLCDLSIDDLCAIENAVLQTVLKTANLGKLVWSAETLLLLVATVWRRRLPVVGRDIWPTFEMHGMPPNRRASFCRYFDFGLQVLVLMQGRHAIKKNRVKAMSIGRYLTPGQEEYFGPSPSFSF